MGRHWITGRVAGCVLLLLVTACATRGTEGTSQTKDTSQDPVTPTTSSAEALPLDYEVETGTPPVEGGAMAAPDVEAFVIYDDSEDARARFLAWWNYESRVAQDSALPAESIYTAGLYVCVGNSQGTETDAILAKIESYFHMTPTGAAGVYRSAIETLCVQYDFGYLTGFDRSVQTMMTELSSNAGVPTDTRPFYVYGFFLKETCSALAKPQVGGTGIWNHLVAMGTQLELMDQGAVSEVMLRIYIKAAVSGGCPFLNLHLPPVIQMAY